MESPYKLKTLVSLMVHTWQATKSHPLTVEVPRCKKKPSILTVSFLRLLNFWNAISTSLSAQVQMKYEHVSIQLQHFPVRI